MAIPGYYNTKSMPIPRGLRLRFRYVEESTGGRGGAARGGCSAWCRPRRGSTRNVSLGPPPQYLSRWVLRGGGCCAWCRPRRESTRNVSLGPPPQYLSRSPSDSYSFSLLCSSFSVFFCFLLHLVLVGMRITHG